MDTASKRIVFFLSIITMIASLGAALITPIFSVFLYDNMGFSIITIGLIYSFYTVALVIFPIPFGMFSDRKGRKPTVVLGLFGYSISYLLRIIARNAGEFGGLSALEGLGDSAFKPATQSAIADVVPSEERGSAYGLFNCATTGAVIVGYLLSGVVAVWLTFTVSFLLGGLFCLLSCFIVAFFMKETLLLEHKEKFTLDLKRIFPQKIRRPLVVYLVALILSNFAIAAIFPILSIFVILQYSLPLYFVGLVWFAYMVAYFISSIPTGKLADTYSSKNITGLGLLVTAVSLYLLGTQNTLLFLMLSSVIFGAGSAMITTAGTAYMMNLTFIEIRGRTVSVLNMLKMTGGALGPIVSGILWERFAPQYSFIIPAIAIFIAGVLFLIIGIPDKEIKKLMVVNTH